MADEYKVACQGCFKAPVDIPEYVMMAQLEECTPEEYVMNNEGTFNSSNGHFLCDNCYINAGCPTEPFPGRWVCP